MDTTDIDMWRCIKPHVGDSMTPDDALCVFAQQVISSPQTLQQKSVAVQCFLRIAQAVLRQPELAIDDLVTFLVRPSGKPRSTDSRSSWWRVHYELIEAVKARTGHHPDDKRRRRLLALLASGRSRHLLVSGRGLTTTAPLAR